MPRKLKLTPGPSNDVSIIGIACQLKDYRMAFELNRRLHFSFIRIDDFIPETNEGMFIESSSCTFYCYKNKEDRRNYFLLSNRHQGGLLLGSPKGTDYLIIINDDMPDPYLSDLLRRIQSIPQVQLAFVIDIQKTKNIDVLLEDIELQALEAKKVM